VQSAVRHPSISKSEVQGLGYNVSLLKHRKRVAHRYDIHFRQSLIEPTRISIGFSLRLCILLLVDFDFLRELGCPIRIWLCPIDNDCRSDAPLIA
jgi:hypothetical protein